MGRKKPSGLEAAFREMEQEIAEQMARTDRAPGFDEQFRFDFNLWSKHDKNPYPIAVIAGSYGSALVLAANRASQIGVHRITKIELIGREVPVRIEEGKSQYDQ